MTTHDTLAAPSPFGGASASTETLSVTSLTPSTFPAVPMPQVPSVQKPPKNATIHDVAILSGYSIGTVSAVINRKETVSKGTRRKVLQAISDLQYRPSAAARRRLQPTMEKSIGLIVKEINNPYFADIISGSQEAARELGYNVLVAHTDRSYEFEQQVAELLVAKDVDGLIINPLLSEESDLSHLFEIRRNNIPLVLIEGVRGMQASTVDVDNVAAEKEAVEHLIGLGHERIGRLPAPATPSTARSESRASGAPTARTALRSATRTSSTRGRASRTGTPPPATTSKAETARTAPRR